MWHFFEEKKTSCWFFHFYFFLNALLGLVHFVAEIEWIHFLWKKDIRYQYINSFQINCFLSITLKFILTGVGLFKVILVGTGVQLKLRKHPNAYIAIKWNLNLLVITFLTTLTPLARVVLRNYASPSDGDNTRLVCVRGDQCHDHIKDIRKRVD